jgi:hypothetical protein
MGWLLCAGVAACLVACGNGGGPVEMDASVVPDARVDRGNPPQEDDAGQCDPPRCEPEQCGVIENSCGSTDCGQCSCQPETCDDIGAECGVIDNTCGGDPIDCGTPGCEDGFDCDGNRCICAPDEAEDNEIRDDAFALGTVREDKPDTFIDLPGLRLQSLEDIDWYRAEVKDESPPLDQSVDPWPQVTITPASGAPDIEVTLFYECIEGTEAHESCTNAEPVEDPDLGPGCRGQGGRLIELETECDGTTDESGTLFIGVRYAGGERVCDEYRLELEVD